ncbi:MAG: HPr family phosphocarrier protein [Clostridiales bacterium]|nr:HPr family phosphocarrier protein [Clostridiales bacterium]
MISKKVVITEKILDTDFEIMLARKCSIFHSYITMYAKDQTVNLKSIVNIFGTTLEIGEEVEIVFSGGDEENASNNIMALLEQ